MCGSLLSLSQAVDIPSAVLLMKRTVPEFKSKNYPYEQYDLRIERERQAAGQQPSCPGVFDESGFFLSPE